jgi:hypothetical protein
VSRGGQWVVVLCEDETSYNFVEQFLLLKGVVKKQEQIKDVICPKGCGSGEKFVRLNLPEALEACRWQRRRGKFALLIVVTDADTGTVGQRIEALRKECEDPKKLNRDGIQAKPVSYIQPDDHATVFIPRRNIETWLKLLNGQAVNEVDDYKQSPNARRCRTEAKALLDHCQEQTLPLHTVASLAAACDEYRRILPLLPQS